MKTLQSIIIFLVLATLTKSYPNFVNAEPMVSYGTNNEIVYNSSMGDCPVKITRCSNIPPSNT